MMQLDEEFGRSKVDRVTAPREQVQAVGNRRTR